jgi:hypothetical protein
MDDSSRMYRDLPEGLCIKYTPSNMRNISGDDIRCPCKRCKNKKNSRSKYCNDTSSIKKLHREILVLICT